MRYVTALLLATAAVSAGVPTDVEQFTLSNGTRVITRQTGSSSIEGLAVFLEGGSLVLDERTAGVENLALEACMNGSERFPGASWRALMDSTQARLEGVYAYDFSALRMMCLEEDLPVLLDALADCLIAPELETGAFERTRDRLLQILQQEESDPDSRVWQVANEGLFEGHPYRFDPSGTPGTMAAFSSPDVEEHLRSRLASGNILISHVGPTGRNDLEAMLEASFGRIPEGGGDLPAPPAFSLVSDTVIIDSDSSSVGTAYLVAKFPAPSPDDPGYPLFSAAMDAVSERFWQVLRTERGLTYAPFAGAGNSRRNWAYLYVSTPEPSTACSLMTGIVLQGASGGFTESDLAGSLETERTGRMMALASAFNQAYLLGMYQIQSGDWRNLWLYSDIPRNMDPAGLGDVLTRWLGPVSWGVIGDPETVDPGRFSPPPLLEEQ